MGASIFYYSVPYVKVPDARIRNVLCSVLLSTDGKSVNPFALSLHVENPTITLTFTDFQSNDFEGDILFPSAHKRAVLLTKS